MGPTEGTSATPQYPDLVALHTNFTDIFASPKGLPPDRFQDRAIHLVEGSNPVKVRPYCYPHSQKAQIEKMVLEMLNQGIIQPSNNPFTYRYC